MLDRRAFLGTALAAATAAAPRPLFAETRNGTFTGASGHVASGGAEIDGDTVTLLDDFTFDGAPDPKVALGRDGFDPSTLMASLKSDSGTQSYAVPAGIDISAYNEVWIWCEQYNVPLAVAKIN